MLWFPKARFGDLVLLGGVCRGMEAVRWFEAEEGVRRSKRRRWESEETEERMEGECGEKEAE